MLAQSQGFFPDYGTATTTGVAPPAAPADASSDWTTSLAQIVGYYTQWDMANKLYDLNLARVQQGLQPITAEQVTPGVTVGVSSDVKNLVMLGLAVAGGLFLFSMLRR